MHAARHERLNPGHGRPYLERVRALGQERGEHLEQLA